MSLNGKRVLLTGGSLGIGKETAKVLIEAGAKVVITGRSAERLEAAAKEIGATPLVFDVSDYANVKPSVDKAAELLGGGIDILINNAGIGNFPTLEEVTIEDFEKVYSVNVFGLAMVTQAALPYLKTSKGDIVNLASTAGLKGFARGTVYSSSKFAVRSMTQGWQAELRKEDIRVILVNPSEVPTAFNQENREEKPNQDGKLTVAEIAHTIKATLEMDKRGFIPEVTVWATNPWQ